MAEEADMGFKMEPGELNAAFYKAYQGDCDCVVCLILRKAVEKSITPYLPKKVRKK